MALKITLKPHEKIIIDGAVVRNGDDRCGLIIENNVPILRQKDIMSEKQAASPARRIYFVIQLMYIDEKNLALYHQQYWQMVEEFINAAPSRLAIIDQINDDILQNQYYHALKCAKQLIEYEREAIRHASESIRDIPFSRKGDASGSRNRSPRSHPGSIETEKLPEKLGCERSCGPAG